MSAYNFACVSSSGAGRLLLAIDLPTKIIPRAQDVWINKDFSEITVFTHSGGENRLEHVEQHTLLENHPLYLRDHDWSEDSTYAEFIFKVSSSEKNKLQLELDNYPWKDPSGKKRVLEMLSETATEKLQAFLGGASSARAVS